MFGFDQAMRFLRQKWKGPNATQLLAEELATMFQGTEEIKGNAPVTVDTSTSTDPRTPLTLAPPPNTAGITIRNTDGTTTTVGPDGITNEDGEGNQSRPSGGGLIGKITGGSGTSYTVALYENGLSAALTQTVTATAPYLNSDEDIPNNSVVGVIQAGNVYHILTAYWL